MSQSRLSDLAILSIEQPETQEINVDNIVKVSSFVKKNIFVF